MGNELEELYEVIKGLEIERDELKAKCEELEKK